MKPIPLRIDAPLLDRVKAFARRHGMTEAGAMRRLIQAGLSSDAGEVLTGPAIGDLHLQLRDLTDEIASLHHEVTAMGLDFGDVLRVGVEAMIGMRMVVAKVNPEHFNDLTNQRDRYLKLHAGGRRSGGFKESVDGKVTP